MKAKLNMCIVYHFTLFTIPPDIYAVSYLTPFTFLNYALSETLLKIGLQNPFTFASLVLAQVSPPLRSISNNPLQWKGANMVEK